MTETPLAQDDILSQAPPLRPELSSALHVAPDVVGQVALQEVAPQSALATTIDALSELTIRVTDDDTLDSDQKTGVLIDFVTDNKLFEVLEEGSYETSDLKYFLEVADDIGSKTGLTLSNMLDSVDQAKLQELFAADDEHLMGVLQHGYRLAMHDEDHYFSHVSTVEYIVGGIHGRMINWLDKGEAKEDLPYFMRQLTYSRNFELASVNSEFNNIVAESRGKPLENRLKLRHAEKAILEAYGVSAEMSRDFRTGLRSRTAPSEKGKLKDFNEIGGIDKDQWQWIVSRYCQTVRSVGVEDAEMLYKTCGIVNFDRYEARQLWNQVDLLARLDAAEAANRPIEDDISVSFADALGDHNGALNHIGSRENPNTSLMFEVKKPDDIPRFFELLKKMNIQPSTLILNTHGGTGLLGYNRGREKFYLTTYDSKSPNMYNIAQFNFGQLIRDGMKPGKDTGERTVLLFACKQAAGRGKIEPMAEALILQTQAEDKVVVKAARESVAIGDVFYLPDSKEGMLTKTRNFLLKRRPLSKIIKRTDSTGPDRIAQTHEFRRGQGPREVIVSRPTKGTPIRKKP